MVNPVDENHVKTNSFRAFLLAARPKTLSGAAVPIMIGVTLAIHDMGWSTFVSSEGGRMVACAVPSCASLFAVCHGYAD